LQRSLPIGNNKAAVVTDAATALIDTLFRQYEQSICGYLARMTGSVARAQELTQETFVRAYRALLRGEQWDNPRAWLYRVASRLATDDHRRRKLLEWLPLSGEEPAPEPDVETTVTDRVAVQAALDALPPKYRIPLVLHAYAGCTVAEIAQTLELSESGVKSRLSRAREKFRRAYGQEERR
jgi:RNA polymerase sigma-70 factor (ECF subfamily)